MRIAVRSSLPPRRGQTVSRLSVLGAGLLMGLMLSAWQQHLSRARTSLAADPINGPATSAEEAPLAGLKGLVLRTFKEFNKDHIPAVAGGATFFALLALFPALAVFVSLYGLIADVAKARAEVAGLAGFLLEGGVTVLTQQIDRLAALPHADLGLTFATSLALSVWSANAGMKSLIAGLNIAYEEAERRGFFALNLQSLAFTVGALALAVLGIAAIAATPALLGFLHMGALQGLSVLRWPVLLGMIIVMISALYRFGPSGRTARWRWITPGSVFAGVTWLAVSLLFSLYVNNFGSYDKTYGSLGAVVGFMTWIWLSLTVVLAGAELNCELERQQTSPLGPRGGAES